MKTHVAGPSITSILSILATLFLSYWAMTGVVMWRVLTGIYKTGQFIQLIIKILLFFGVHSHGHNIITFSQRGLSSYLFSKFLCHQFFNHVHLAKQSAIAINWYKITHVVIASSKKSAREVYYLKFWPLVRFLSVLPTVLQGRIFLKGPLNFCCIYFLPNDMQKSCQ
jgi:hypothetical protein